MGISRFNLSFPAIAELLDQLPRRVFTARRLSTVLGENQALWALPHDMNSTAFRDLLIRTGLLREVTLHGSITDDLSRYVWRDGSRYEIALSVRNGAYLSHGTAVLLHALSEQLPKTIYVNAEQSPKPRSQSTLTQGRIDQAFSRAQRETRLEYRFDGERVRVLSGKHTGGLGVVNLAGPRGEDLPVTSLERTLIDITVRPAYGGGPYGVLQAFSGSLGRLSSDRLVTLLQRLDYVYPYHQAIGFYMEAAGFDDASLAPLRALGLEFDFYLAYGLRDTSFVPSWRVHVPRGFQLSD